MGPVAPGPRNDLKLDGDVPCIGLLLKVAPIETGQRIAHDESGAKDDWD